MADVLKSKDDVGHILVQVQNDLRQLKKNLGRLTVQENGEILDIQALDTAISRTEHGIRRHAEEYLKTLNSQVLTLPCIQEPEKKSDTAKLVTWQPPYDTIPRPYKIQITDASPGEKHKSAFAMRLLSNPFHPKSKVIVQQRYGIELPHLPKRSQATMKNQRLITVSTVGNLAAVQGGLSKHLFPKPSHFEPDRKAGDAGLPSAADLSSVQTPEQPKALHSQKREDSGQAKMDESEKAYTWQMDVNREDGMDVGRSAEGRTSSGIRPPPPSAASASSDNRVLAQGLTRLTPLHPQNIPMPISKYPLTIIEGQVDPSSPDYCRFKKKYCLCWGAIVDALNQLQQMLLDFSVPLAQVCGERLAFCVQGGNLARNAGVEKLLSLLDNRDEVWDLMCQPGQRYKGKGSHHAAAVCIQTCWRRYTARAAYLLLLLPKWAAQTIALSLLKRAKLKRLRMSLEASRLRHLENYRIRAEYLAANWKHITCSKRTIIHVPSLGYSQAQRLSLKGFDILQNTQMGRLCDIRDEEVEVIYVSPVALGEDVIQYYTHLMGLQAAIELDEASAPQAVANVLLSSCQKHWIISGPRALKRIKNLIQGKQAYMIGGVTHIDELAVADELGVPLLGTEPAVVQLYGTKSGGRRIFSSAGVNVPPGKWDVYTLEQLHEGLTQLMIEHMEVKRWLFKIDSEIGGRGMAYCDVCHLRCFAWAQKQYKQYGPENWRMMAEIREPVMMQFSEEVPYLLASHARPVNTSCYSTWAGFVEHFLREGGVIEAYPPSDSMTSLTVDMLVEPGGDVHMMSCGDQLHAPSMFKVVGCTMPQTSICPEVLHSICIRVGQACRQRCIMGHLSLDLVTFLEPTNLEQEVWAVDLDLGYSNQLAMTQVMLMMTGGTLDCRTSKLEVPARDMKTSARKARQTSVTSRFAVMATRLTHTNLSLVYYSTFFLMCKAQGIGYDVKERKGTVFVLHDSKDRRSLGMLTISEHLPGALLTFARNLSIIHQEISAPNMQGTNNFKDIIKDIEEVLRMTKQNQTESQEEVERPGPGQISSHTIQTSALNEPTHL